MQLPMSASYHVLIFAFASILFLILDYIIIKIGESEKNKPLILFHRSIVFVFLFVNLITYLFIAWLYLSIVIVTTLLYFIQVVTLFFMINKNNKLVNVEQRFILQQVPDYRLSSGLTTDCENIIQSNLLQSQYQFIKVIPPVGCNKIQQFKYYFRQFKKNEALFTVIRGVGFDSFPAILAAKLRKQPVLLAVHGLWSDSIYISNFKRFLFKYLIEYPQLIMANSIYTVYENAINKRVLSRFKKKYLGYIYNPIPECTEVAFCHQNKDAHTINGLFVGRITREKGLDYLIDALIRYFNENGDSKFLFTFVGDGPEISRYKSIVQEHNLTNKIIFKGEIKNVQEELVKSQIFIFPSLHENHPSAILEAISNRLFIIATSVGGVTETLANYPHGKLINPHSSEEIYNSLKCTIDEELYNKSINQSEYFALTNKFSYENFEINISQLYKSFIIKNKIHKTMNK